MNRNAVVLPLAMACAALAPAAFAAEPAKPVTVAQAAAKKSESAKPAGAKDKPLETRNWADVDTNKDGLISPEEMEAYLKANPGPLKGK